MAARMREPIVVLAILTVLSLAARVAWLDAPCRTPCRGAAAHVLVFDEVFYVNAARAIAGVPLSAGGHYVGTPAGDDPNSEHPQLAKLVIAGAIEVFGDGPFAWRIGSVVFGSLAILGLYVLVRAVGGDPRLAVLACALMAADNLLLVHGRIGTLDIYAVAAMIWGAALYARGSPLGAGLVVGIGACFKLVVPYVLFALIASEALRSWSGRQRAGARPWLALLTCVVTAAGVFIGALAVLDKIAPPYDPITRRLVGGGVFGHLHHMISYAAGRSSPSGPHGIASYPWQWLGDFKPILYLNIDDSHPAPGLYGIHPEVHFLGMISPPILLAAVAALLMAALGLVPRRHAGVRRTPAAIRRLAPPPSPATVFGLAWFLGTWIPFEVLSAIWSRTSYLYYMAIVMPGLYILAADLVRRIVRGRWTAVAWAGAVIVAAVLMYPLTPLP
jgi:hypothetical protein